MTKETIKYMYHVSDLGYVVHKNLNSFATSTLLKGGLATAEPASYTRKTNVFMRFCVKRRFLDGILPF